MGKITKIESLFFDILLFSYLFPALVFLFLSKKIRHEARVIIILVYSLTIFSLLFSYDYLPRAITRYWYQIIFTSVEYLSFASFFGLSILNKPFRKVIVVLSIAFVIFQILFTFSSKFSPVDSVPIAIESILVFLYCFYFLFQEFKREDDKLIVRNPVFWIMIGMVFYIAGSFFFNILANHFTKEDYKNYWFYSYLFDILKNILLALGMIFFNKENKLGTKKDFIPYLDIE